jgi:hypothetical protein
MDPWYYSCLVIVNLERSRRSLTLIFADYQVYYLQERTYYVTLRFTVLGYGMRECGRINMTTTMSLEGFC